MTPTNQKRVADESTVNPESELVVYQRFLRFNEEVEIGWIAPSMGRRPDSESI